MVNNAHKYLYVSSLTPSFLRPVTPASGPSAPLRPGGFAPTVASPTRASALESGTTIKVPVNTVCACARATNHNVIIKNRKRHIDK